MGEETIHSVAAIMARIDADIWAYGQHKLRLSTLVNYLMTETERLPDSHAQVRQAIRKCWFPIELIVADISPHDRSELTTQQQTQIAEYLAELRKVTAPYLVAKKDAEDGQ